MKKLWLFLALFIAATAIRQAYDTFGPRAQAFRAYRIRAEAEARATGANDPRFEGVEGNVTNVSYRLEFAEGGEDGTVRLTVVEAIQFQRFSETGPFGSRRVAQTRQHAVMRLADGEWVLSDLREEATEVTELGGPTPSTE